MRVKNFLHRFGYDVKRYHSLYDLVLKHHSIQTVLDIGANDGEWSAEMRRLFPRTQVYAFEPLADRYEGLAARFKGDARFRAFNVALGEQNSETEIERSSFHPSSSLLHMSDLHKELYPKSKNIKKEKIMLRRLDSFDKEVTLAPDILIKLDVQGFEDKVILGGENIFKQAKIIICETSFVQLYEGQPLFGDIHEQLGRLGFAYRGNCSEHYSKKTGERIYEDSVFLRV